MDCETCSGNVQECARAGSGLVRVSLLFIIVFEALSSEFQAVTWEDLYADGLVSIADSMEECLRRLLTWKEGMERKGLRVNVGKTKIMICGTQPITELRGVPMCHLPHWSRQQQHSLQWLQALGSQEMQWAIDGRPQKKVQVGPDKLEVVASFCYLGDMLSMAGGCEFATTTSVETTWKKFKEMLPVLSSCHLSYKTRGRVYSSCIPNAMLHASETWPLTMPNLQRLRRNDRAMIRQICNVKPEDQRSCWHNLKLKTLTLS